MRMDTIGGDDASNDDDDGFKYKDQEDDNDDLSDNYARDRGDFNEEDKLSVNLDDLNDEQDDSDDVIDLQNSKGMGHNLQSLAYSSGSLGTNSTNSGLKAENLFAVGQSNDKGLAEMETGSEVYMSELLVSLQ